MMVPNGLTDQATGIVLELLSARRHLDHDGFDDAVLRALDDIEATGDHLYQRLLHATVVSVLAQLAAVAVGEWCRSEHDGDWAATVAAVRARLLG